MRLTWTRGSVQNAKLFSYVWKCDVTKTVTLRSGDMIWRYGLRSCWKKETEGKRSLFSQYKQFLSESHVARVFHTSFIARRGHRGFVSAQKILNYMCKPSLLMMVWNSDCLAWNVEGMKLLMKYEIVLIRIIFWYETRNGDGMKLRMQVWNCFHRYENVHNGMKL